ncbi:Nal1-like putative serine protease [Rhodobacter capsulatus]|jgi:hypothetical protein|uniref:hypothetical protein n=1 Tax=Rhodobacter capsulatus TaxID=1061 RepID=UPI00103FCAC6|nr:hypothetical protein [Rhodobacter capsulatus]MDS0926428.1 S1 family peptidase [Rhodobacter capsulatus]TQD32426.1 hypothetical protein FKW81_17140 [Rhodobacter capsulatus]
MNDLEELQGLRPNSAKELAEKILGWAKHRNLFDKVPLEDGIEEEDANFQVGPNQFHAQATEEVLRKRSINLVGFSEGEKKVVVFTHNKISKGDEKVLPFAFGDYKVVYIQGGIAHVKGSPPPPQQPQPFTHRNGRYACGSSIFPAHCIGAGTLGLIVRDAAGRLFGMTNNHVAGACNHAMPGLPILAPGPVDATHDACDPFTIGRHSRLLPINDGIPENINIDDNCDVSLFELSDPARVSSFQGNAYDTPAISGMPVPGTRVRKYGRTTGLTSGMIVAQAASAIPVSYNVNEYGVRKNVWFNNIFVVAGDNGLPFSRPGDSGSLVVSDDGAGNLVAVGLVFAGNEQRNQSFILPLPDVLQKLAVDIVTGHHA